MRAKDPYHTREAHPEPDALDEWLEQSGGYLVRLNRRGPMTVPAPIRERLNLTPGVKLIVRIDTQDGDTFWVNPLSTKRERDR